MKPPAPTPYTCRECGQPGDAHDYMSEERLLAEKLCFKCNHWVGLLEVADKPTTVRVNGQHYQIGPANARFPGFAGRKFNIVFDDGRKEATNNLWHQGEIPAHFRARMPDNAEFEKA